MSLSKRFHQHFTEETATTVFRWTLHNLSSCNKKEGEPITSQTFVICTNNYTFLNVDTKWQFELFPAGCSENCRTNICLVLKSFNDSKVKLEGILSIEPAPYKYFSNSIIRHVFEGSNLQQGFSKHLDRNSFLIAEEELERVTITCKMFIIPTLLIQYTFKNNPQDSLLEDIASLLYNKNCCDIQLISSDGIVHTAHKALLCCRSPVFQAMFQHDMKEKQENCVKIKDVDTKTLKQMLEFIYTGNITFSKCDEAKELYTAADKYQLAGLCNICIDYINENLNVDNVLEIYAFAHIYKEWFLKAKVTTYFSVYKKQIMLKKGLQYIQSFSHDILTDLLYFSSMT